ncbi:hypothetical protein AJ78_06903 [Emergomyces pasteurianus Ep9510]|uniref:Novel STAND NTPase 3 domain-containing protein n=1 Tax=Emergomyces pasteurianus Ep9510 TaxID=1447872 RepID=A0A1J9P7A8_9EURO|nr:hypothetical protein AJ78_06903 [Emergomyces pasteurianus Ep9510]
MVGPCTFTSGTLKCMCTEGSCASLIDAVNPDALCNRCLHPMKVHSSYGKQKVPSILVYYYNCGGILSLTITAPPSSEATETPHNDIQPPLPSQFFDICPRERTVQSLARLLEENTVMHIRGTPASGKTTLATLLLHYFSQKGEMVVFINRWDNSMEVLSFLSQKIQQKGYTHIPPDYILSSNVVFIIDEAQQTYSCPEFWYVVIKTQSMRQSGARFCLFSSFGSPITGVLDFPKTFPPPILSPRQRISLTPSSGPESPDVALFYDATEYSDVVRRFCRHPARNSNFEVAAQEYIYSFTNGHPGAINSLLLYIHHYHRSGLKCGRIVTFTLNHVLEAMEDIGRLFSTLEGFPVGRSLPSPGLYPVTRDPEIAEILLEVLKIGSVGFDKQRPELLTCVENGWLQSNLVDGGQEICTFASGMHAKYVEYKFGATGNKPFPYEKYPDIESLCLAVVKRFSKPILRQAQEGRRLGSAGKPRPFEATFQDEFYRCYWEEVGRGIGICSEWTGSSSGHIDFLVIQPGWGIELLRDGGRLHEHCKRFRNDGQYFPWVNKGIMRDWLILDCCHSYPQSAYPQEKNLWRLVFQEDYSTVHILNCENKEKFPKFCLVNH